MDEQNRKPNVFESILLFLGLISVGVGYFFLHRVVINFGLYSAEATNALMLWIIIIILIIITAASENSKEELKIIIKQQHDEIRLLRHDIQRKR